MDEPGLTTLAIGAVILTLLGAWGTAETPRDKGPTLIVLDRDKTEPCGGVAGLMGCKR